MIASGLGYDPLTSSWTRGRNVQIRAIETAESFKVLLDSWNCGTNYWLRECVYKRLARQGRKPGFKSTMATFVTSAFWHGFNPTYYITFLLGGFVQSLGRKVRTNVRPFFLAANYPLLSGSEKTAAERTPLKRVYNFFSWLSVQLVLNFIVAPFMLLSVVPALEAWWRVSFYGLFMTFVPLGLFSLGLGKRLRKMQKARAEKAGVNPETVEKFRKQEKEKAQKGTSFAPPVQDAAKREIKRQQGKLGHDSALQSEAE